MYIIFMRSAGLYASQRLSLDQSVVTRCPSIKLSSARKTRGSAPPRSRPFVEVDLTASIDYMQPARNNNKPDLYPIDSA